MRTDRNSMKIKTLDELERIVQQLREESKIIVHCHGAFDMLHPGHIRHLEAAQKEGDVLMVTVTPDRYVHKGPGRPAFNETLRAESLAALQCVDYVAINQWPTAVETIKKLRPNVYVKGSDYEAPQDDVTGGITHEREAIEGIGGRIHFTDEITFSSSKLLNKYFSVYPDETKEFLEKFQLKYSAPAIIEQLKLLKNVKVLLVGDTIIDEYYYCTAMGKSPKESIISTKFMGKETFAGGILACANHVAGFCENVTLVTCLGTLDSKESFVLEHLKPKVNYKFFYRNDACTIVKRRFVDPAFLTKMFEISFLEDRHLPENTNREVCKFLSRVVGDYDLVLVGDFGHGFLGKDIIDILCEKARFLAVNTQTNSANTGFNLITKYPRADYICIDEPEMRLAAHDRYGNLHDISLDIARRLNSKRLSVTRGHLGSLTYAEENGFFEVPVFSVKVVDRVGAGDAYLSVTAPCVFAGHPMDMVGFVGNAVGALAITVVCNRSPVEPIPLFKFITTLLK